MANGTITFDTHRFVERLIGVEMPKKQAEVLADEFSTTISTHIATKGDIELLRKDLEARIENLEVRMDAKLERLFAKVVWLQLGSVVLTVTILQYLGRG